MLINDPLLKLENEMIRRGEKIDWSKLWSAMERRCQNADIELYGKFHKYIPPYKNTALIFVMAYKRQAGR